MNKQVMVYSHNGMLHHNKKEIYISMGETEKHVESKREYTDTKQCILMIPFI